ncbi:MAG: discoidin domain-containing protein [Verrucomicrobiales bacterium]|nr:discoidin domain-containing protein [Verrucomicrobiales bacterium]
MSLSLSPALSAALVLMCGAVDQGFGQPILDKRKLWSAQTFWDNQDVDWFVENIPFLETPDPELDATYYYRWEVLTKHLTYGSPNTGYCFTEFIDRPFWSGTYGAISCPAGHQLYEARWLRDPLVARDYAKYWFKTPGAQPRNYSTWLGDAVWAVHQVHPDRSFTTSLLPSLRENYRGWEKKHFTPEVGLFWQTGHDDGMEFNINSRQTQDILRGAPAYRTTLNSYMWADAKAIESIATLAGDAAIASEFASKALGIKTNLQARLWDAERSFFFPLSQREEQRDGHVVKVGTLTYQSGQFAGSPYGRELHGYVPWQFNLLDPGFEDAWKFLMDREGFLADFGPLTAERRDPLFKVTDTCCWWSGQSWPYATTQTLLGLANVLNQGRPAPVTRDDYYRLLRTYALTHRKDGKPYIAEAVHPDTGSWKGYDNYNHSEHYFHSGFADLVITGLIGLRPRADDIVEVNPLAPASWDYFALDGVRYHGHELAITWDRTGERYGKGAGFQLWMDGSRRAIEPTLTQLTASLPRLPRPPSPPSRLLNFAVNNDGEFFPRLTTSFSNPKTPVTALQDGVAWYHLHPPNRWTTAGSSNETDWCILDFGTSQPIEKLKLYFLDDGHGIVPPARFDLQFWSGLVWTPITNQVRTPAQPQGRRGNTIEFPAVETARIRMNFTHGPEGRTGLTEVEAWGRGSLPYRPAPSPPGNLAVNRSGRGFPRATASFTSRFGDSPAMAIDGRYHFTPTPMNRWTSYGSTNATDWLEVDFGTPREVSRAELHIYDDRGGVQSPKEYYVEYWTGGNWERAEKQVKTPADAVGGAVNSVRFSSVNTLKIRIQFVHRDKARSGLTELELWKE